MPPFFTVITATYNAAATLPQLLESLAAQSCRDFEWLVQDGCSVDTTLELIEAWRDRLPAVSVQSAPDKGIYDAWNKALDRAESTGLGQWVLFLGADDALAATDVLQRVREQTTAPEAPLFWAGSVSLVDEQGQEEQRMEPLVHMGITSLYLGMPLANPGTFYARSLFAGQRFDVSFAIAGDFDFVAKVWQDSPVANNLHLLVTIMRMGGVSTAMRGRLQTLAESYRISRRYAPVWRVCCRMARTVTLDALYILCKKVSVLEPWRLRARAWYRKRKKSV